MYDSSSATHDIFDKSSSSCDTSFGSASSSSGSGPSVGNCKETNTNKKESI